MISVCGYAPTFRKSPKAPGETEFKGYEYSMVQYGKDEFILAQAAENADMKQKVTDTQLALVEVYELMA